jgi:hypothetical protein
MDRREVLRNIGFEEEDIDRGNVGFEIESMEGYFARECAENRLAQGLPVPEDLIPDQRGQDEKDIWRRVKDMERLELARTQEDKSRMWAWTERDERDWLKEYGYSQGRTLARCEKNVNEVETQTKGSVITMTKQKTQVQEVKQESSALLDFSKNQAVILKGEFKMRRIWSKTKEKWFFILEGENNSIVIGGAGANGKNVWALKTETNQKSSEPTLSEISS